MNSILEIVFLKSELFGDYHPDRHGECKRLFEDVLRIFEEQLRDDIWVSTTRPTWKSLSDRFKNIVGDRRVATRDNDGASTASKIIYIRV